MHAVRSRWTRWYPTAVTLAGLIAATALLWWTRQPQWGFFGWFLLGWVLTAVFFTVMIHLGHDAPPLLTAGVITLSAVTLMVAILAAVRGAHQVDLPVFLAGSVMGATILLRPSERTVRGERSGAERSTRAEGTHGGGRSPHHGGPEDHRGRHGQGPRGRHLRSPGQDLAVQSSRR